MVQRTGGAPALIWVIVLLLLSSCRQPAGQTRTATIDIDLQIPTAPAGNPATVAATATATAAAATATANVAGITGTPILVNGCQVRDDWPTYVVQTGDTLARIALWSQSSVRELTDANCLADANRIVAGQQLNVPRLSPTVTAAPPPTAGSWQRFHEPTTGVSFGFPGHWTRQDGWLAVFGAADGYIRLALHESPRDIDVVVAELANGDDESFGNAPTIVSHILNNNGEGRSIMPSTDQAAQFRGQALFLTYLPEPIWQNGANFNYLILAGDATHIQQIIPTIVMPPAPSAIDITEFDIVVTDTAENTKRVVMTWASTGATRGMIVSGTAQRFAPWWLVAANGEMTVELEGTLFPNPSMTLTVWNDVTGLEARRSIALIWPCADSYFFDPPPERCPRGPALEVVGAYQAFEHGHMIWLPGASSNTIYVLDDENRVYIASDAWDETQPASDPSLIPPAGLLQPQRGFGLAWRENTLIRQRLGWAIAPEFSYALTIQAEARESIPGVVYLTGPASQIFRLRDTVWEVFSP